MKTVNIYLDVNDMDDAIRVLNAINQLVVGELKGFNVYEAYDFSRGPRYVNHYNRHSEEDAHANND